ncbi:hypothetical protein BDY19DRAFT_759377 [Irpex rosettiformis]|uniref:Uncharacterized protein n=1 Tax=Irpex rosettiformis TaxID=378272 RepID=A0ACB8U7X4_9APHY|nr:hypothetical protein BDY19DRAFT_759377 [Irpex rosettiformis]
MSSSQAIPPSPTSSAFIYVPTTPKESAVKPNPHPYAIRTTSTGILSRSNSSGHNVAASRHHYVPLSPAPKDVRRRHRYTKSLTQESYTELSIPRPLPVPETFTGNTVPQTRAGWNGSIRSSRLVRDSIFLSAATLEDLPSNPKLWTTSQLTAYLATALRVSSDSDAAVVNLSTSVVEEVIAFTKAANINGRIFLRLNEDDLDKHGISPSWRDALLAASRNLRQNVIKGRIWAGNTDDLELDPSSLSLASHPFSSALYSSSSSSVDSTDDDREKYKQRRRDRGRVRGMVQTFERSGSFSSESSLEQDASPEKECFQRSSQDVVTVEEPVPMSPINDFFSLPPSPPLPVLEEPTVESLLEEVEHSGTWGARAWEEFDTAPGVTVKRVEESAVADSRTIADTVSRLQSRVAFGNAGTAKSVRLPKGKQDRRVITAIFAPPASETSEARVSASEVVHVAQSGANDKSDTVQITLPSVDSTHVQVTATKRELVLEAELAETRALVHAFRVRLEEVERKVADLEVEVHRNETTREKFVSVVTTAGTAQSEISILADIEPDSAASLDSDLSSSTLFDDEPAVGYETYPNSPLHTPSSTDKKSAEESGTPDAHDSTEPSSMAELPHYVLLVGLGVCAIVLRVIMKRTGRGLSWR